MDVNMSRCSSFSWSPAPPPPPPPPPLSIRGSVCPPTSPQRAVRSAPTGWQRCSGPGPAWTAGSGSSCWSTCRLSPPAPERWRSTLWWPPLVAVDRHTEEEIWIQPCDHEKASAACRRRQNTESPHTDIRMCPVLKKGRGQSALSSVRHKNRHTHTHETGQKRRKDSVNRKKKKDSSAVSPIPLQLVMTGSQEQHYPPNVHIFIYIYLFIYLFLYLLCTGPLAIWDHENATDVQTHKRDSENMDERIKDTSSCLYGNHSGNHSFYVHV